MRAKAQTQQAPEMGVPKPQAVLPVQTPEVARPDIAKQLDSATRLGHHLSAVNVHSTTGRAAPVQQVAQTYPENAEDEEKAFHLPIQQLRGGANPIQRHEQPEKSETDPPTHRWREDWDGNRKGRELEKVLGEPNLTVPFGTHIDHMWAHAQKSDPGYLTITEKIVNRALDRGDLSKGHVVEVYKSASDAKPGSFSFSQTVPESEQIIIHAHMENKDKISTSDKGPTGAVHWKFKQWSKTVKGRGKIPVEHREKLLNIGAAADMYEKSGAIKFQEASGLSGKHAEAVGESLGFLPASVLGLIGEYVKDA